MFGDDYQMYVIAHQAISQNREASLTAVFFQQLKVDTTVLFGEENQLAIDPTLGDMVRHAGRNETSFSRHSADIVAVASRYSHSFCEGGRAGRPRLPPPLFPPPPLPPHRTTAGKVHS